MERNYPLIRKVLDHVRAHPEEHNQSSFFHPGETLPGEDVHETGMRMLRGEIPFRCGTTACLAGWAVILSGAMPKGFYLTPQAALLLGLDPDEASDIFYTYTRDAAIAKLQIILDEESA